MPLSAGTTLAHYEILEPIGKGGMGEVYRAKDTKLGRDVAIKVLPDEFAQDEERLRRFQREAKVLASLNHPNIASIYGLEQSSSTHYLVLELVPGETVADRIARGPIPVEESLEIATKIAEALEEAHEQGIVHRDLKPANVKLTPDDKVKVLDFGLAKAFVEEGPEGDAASSMSPTITRDATRVGVILGTAAYMSPEQAKGKRVDHRADIWAFGTVVFEMLTGKRAFNGEDVSETLAAVIRAEPDLGERRIVSVGGGTHPVWSPNGRELWYRSYAMMRVSVDFDESDPTEVTIGTPQELFDFSPYRSRYDVRAHALSPDGQRVLTLREEGPGRGDEPVKMILVQNWFQELERLVPTSD